MSNGPARNAGVPQTLQQAGDISGDPFEISTIRREVKVLVFGSVHSVQHSCQMC